MNTTTDTEINKLFMRRQVTFKQYFPKQEVPLHVNLDLNVLLFYNNEHLL